MSRQVDTSDLSKLDDAELDYAHERYLISEEAWLEEVQSRGGETHTAPSEPSEPTSDTVDYESMTKAELTPLLEARGFEVTSGATKAEMISVLTDDDAAKAAEGQEG